MGIRMSEDDAQKTSRKDEPGSPACSPACSGAEAPAARRPAASRATCARTAPEAPRRSLVDAAARGPVALVLGAIGTGITDLFTKRKLDEATLEELEDVLVRADLGIDVAGRIVDAVGKGRYGKDIAPEEVKAILAAEVERTLPPVAKPLVIDPGQSPSCMLMVGVNGSGKTTTIGKLAAKFRARGPLGDAGGRRHLPRRGHRAARRCGASAPARR